MTIGRYYELEILRRVDFGVYLASELGDILCPQKYLSDDDQLGDFINVFLYKDSEDRLIATTLQPYGQLDDFVALQVKDTNAHGAFMEWGLEKDLFVPLSEQPQRYNVGDIHVVRICLDQKTERLIGVGKLKTFFSRDLTELYEGEEVSGIIYDETELGFKVVINQKYEGLIYQNQVFQPLRVGDELKVFIDKIREDGKIDLRIQEVGLKGLDQNADKIYSLLTSGDGFLPLHDKSSPEEITKMLKMSKKAFKKAIGILYKQRKIEISPEGIKLISS